MPAVYKQRVDEFFATGTGIIAKEIMKRFASCKLELKEKRWKDLKGLNEIQKVYDILCKS